MSAEISADGAFEFGARHPIVAQRLDGFVLGLDLLRARGEQLVVANQHSVVVQQHPGGDGAAHRHDLTFVKARGLAVRGELVVQRAHVGAVADGESIQLAFGAAKFGLALGDARLALVEQRQFQPQRRPGHVLVVGAVLGVHAEFQRADVTIRLREPERADEAREFAVRGGEIVPLRHGERFEAAQRHVAFRQRRQIARDFPSSVAAPQAQQPVEFFAVFALRILRHREFEPRGIVSRLLPREREIVDVPRLVLPLREVERGVVDVRDGAPVREHRAVGLEPIHRRLHLGDEPHRLIRHAELRGGEMRGSDALAQREHEQVEEVEHGGFLPIRAGRRAVGETHAQIEARVFPHSRLAQVCGGHAHVLEGREQFTVVEQRDLHRAVHRQRLFQKCAHLRERGFASGGVLLPAHGEAGAFLHGFLDGERGRFLRCGERGQRECGNHGANNRPRPRPRSSEFEGEDEAE